MLSTVACNKLQARDHLNKGVQAYKGAKYEEAIDHFQKAVSLDPGLINARLYLATAYAQQYIPGADTEDNNRMAQQAIDQYKAVLERDPKNVNSVKGIAYLYLQMKKFEDAKQYYRKASELDPNDPEAYYSIGVIDWTQSYQPRMEERSKLGLKPEEPLKDKKVCNALRQKVQDVIQDGISMLEKALQLRPDYDDAMAYMNLLYRERADLQCDNPAARAADLKTADEWVDKTMAVKKAKAEKQPGNTGITMDQNK
jgi:tetratricopeptide (TPR) repeat protein